MGQKKQFNLVPDLSFYLCSASATPSGSESGNLLLYNPSRCPKSIDLTMSRMELLVYLLSNLLYLIFPL
jgi:hypothetical protein